MHTLEIPRKKKNDIIYFPENWEEMTEKQFLKIMELVVKFEKGDIDYMDLKLQSTMVLVGIVKTNAPLSREDEETKFGNLAVLSNLLDFIIELKPNKKNKLEAKLNFDSIKQFIPKIKSYKGAMPALTNLTWEQLTHASTFYKKYIQTKDESHLDGLVASLYLEEDAEFNPDDVLSRKEELADLPYFVKYATFLFFRNSLMYLQNNKINMNGEDVDLSILFKDNKKQAKADGLGLVGLQMGVAESGVFGNMKQVGKENIYDIYAYLYKNKHAYLEWDKERRKQSL